MHTILTIGQVVSGVVVTILILFQERSSGMSGLLGGASDEGGFYQTRRGLEKMVFVGTIVFSTLFLVLSILNLTI